jgi:hypothetical protein
MLHRHRGQKIVTRKLIKKYIILTYNEKLMKKLDRKYLQEDTKRLHKFKEVFNIWDIQQIGYLNSKDLY